jgi:RNA polymerase sigma-70 factor (ECF subfamily)
MDSWPSTRVSLLLAIRDPANGQAWGEFVHRYRPLIVQFCQHRLGVQEAAAEDVAQGVLLKLVKVMQEFAYDPQQSFRGWLRTVTRNAVFDYWKGEKARPDVAAGDSRVHEMLHSIPVAETSEQLSEILSGNLFRDLLAEVERLVRDRVEATTWRAYELRRQETPAREIASQLNMKVAAVHKAYSRVKQLLREEIALLLPLQQPRG